LNERPLEGIDWRQAAIWVDRLAAPV